MPESLYYIQKDGNEVGPLSFAQMRSLWGRAEITVRTSFRYEKESIWRPVALLQSELDEPMEMPPALATQKPEKTGSYTKTGCGCLFIGIVLFIIIASASNRNQSSSSRLDNYPPVKATSQHVESPAPTITWKEIDEFFFKGNNTDQQRADKLKYYKGRQVSWRGRVVKTSEKLFGGMTLSIKMNADTITHDVDLDLKSSETSRATALSENSLVTFNGIVDNIDWGLFGGVKLKEGEIHDTPPQAIVDALRVELAKEDLSTHRKIEVLEDLTKRDPSNKEWSSKLAEEKTASSRKAMIDQQFSGWDGSHYALVKLVKEQMNDPNSFEHVKTLHWDMKTHVVISMTFRGSNAFGGKVTQTVKAKAALDGSTVKVTETL